MFEAMTEVHILVVRIVNMCSFHYCLNVTKVPLGKGEETFILTWKNISVVGKSSRLIPSSYDFPVYSSNFFCSFLYSENNIFHYLFLLKNFKQILNFMTNISFLLFFCFFLLISIVFHDVLYQWYLSILVFISLFFIEVL